MGLVSRRAALELMIFKLSENAPGDLISGPASPVDGALCKAVRAAATGGQRVRLTGVHKEKVHTHASFSSYGELHVSVPASLLSTHSILYGH
jgi:hypothetical protein